MSLLFLSLNRPYADRTSIQKLIRVCCILLWMPILLKAKQTQYSSQWAVHLDGGNDVADEIAKKHDFINYGEIMPGFYHFQHRRVAKRSLDPSDHHHLKLVAEPKVVWAKQQQIKGRVKRDVIVPTKFRSSRQMSPVLLNDLRWPQMWYLNRGGGLDMNVQGAWREGITGQNVVVTILDDGLEKDHPDLVRNYDPQASYDVNNHDEDPMPRYDLIDSNRHGTRCAGEVAASANNSFCAVGVAYGASVGGVRMLDGDVTDAVEARSLSLNPQHIDIYSASWGPDDDGKTVDGPGELATRAFVEGVTKGRNGKGSIFVWASGNGGRDHDNCNCDGYTNSIWTLSISSATESGKVPWYSEACSSTLATTYSSGSANEKQVVTTDLHHQCTSSHTGTSASAPLAAGICALALEANPNIGWRDMQHIVVRTARPMGLNARDWQVNGVGRNVSHSFGYGLMDASAMVRLARKWKPVPEQKRCEVAAPHMDKIIPSRSQVTLSLNVENCPGVNYMEHVQAKISLGTNRRGDIQIVLKSPAGTQSTLLAKRPHDQSRAGFQAWPFMTVHNWGEKPTGTWQLEIHSEGLYRAILTDWNLIIYGTEEPPQPLDELDQDKQRPPPVVGSPPASDILQHLGPAPRQHMEYPRTTTAVSTGSADAASGVPTAKSSSIDGMHLTSGCVRVDKSNNLCLACASSLFLVAGRCDSACPRQHFESEVSAEGIPQPSCLPCHYSCMACSGSNDYQCSACFGDATLTLKGQSDSYCYPKALMSAVVSNRWYFWMFFAFCLNLILVSGAVIYIVVSKMHQKDKSCGVRYQIVNGKPSSKEFLSEVTALPYHDTSSDEDGG